MGGERYKIDRDMGVGKDMEIDRDMGIGKDAVVYLRILWGILVIVV